MNEINQEKAAQNLECNDSKNEIIKMLEAEIEKWRNNGYKPVRIDTRKLSIPLENIDQAIRMVEQSGKPMKNHYDFLRFVKACGLCSAFWHYHLIPNQNGTLCRERDLRNGEAITQELIRIIRMFIKSDASRFVDTDYCDIAEFEQYSWNDLFEKIGKMEGHRMRGSL